MAGFAKFTVVGNVAGIEVVNVFHYRSDTWLPFVGNPFVQMTEAIAAFVTHVKAVWLAALPEQYVLQRVEGVGYSDTYAIVTPAPVVQTIQETGDVQAPAFDSFALSANIKFVLGAQQSINGLGESQRNRGYIAFGPLWNALVSDDGHFTGSYVSTSLDAVANKLRDSIADAGDLATIVPIRIHEKFVANPIPGQPPILVFRTYSDIQGYVLPTRVTFRRSRLPEV